MNIFKKDKSESVADSVPDNRDTVQPDNDGEQVMTKMDKARIVFTEMYGQEGIKRKDIIARFISDCALTKAGASTYYAKIKKQFHKGDK